MRIGAVVTGAVLMIAAASGAWVLTWMISDAYPQLMGDRYFLVLGFAPITAIGVAACAVGWTQWFHASSRDMALALLIVELLLLGVVAAIAGRLWMDTTFAFWMIASLMFVPSWTLGWAVGRWRARCDH